MTRSLSASAWQPAAPLSAYFASLDKNTKLVELDLSNARLDEADSRALAEGLKKNYSIKQLNVRQCQFEGNVAMALQEAYACRPDMDVIS